MVTPKRYADALMIQRGACNPNGIVNALSDALKQLFEEGADTKTRTTDPAVRLMVHQLAWICGTDSMDLTEYQRLIHRCEDLTQQQEA